MSLKRNKIKYFIPSIAWMGLIFAFSNQPAELSTKNNNFIVDCIYKISPSFVEFFGDELLNHLVRKIAHITEYFILFSLLFYAFYKIYRLKEEKNQNKIIVYSSLITVLYACSDEIHQVFIPGREGAIKDVCIDSIGVLLGILLIKIYSKIKEKGRGAEDK